MKRNDVARENKVIVRRFYEELFGGGNRSAIDDLFASDFVDRTFAPGKEAGLDEVKHAFIAFRKAFPDARVHVEDIVAEGDKVTVRFTWRGTHESEFLGIAATGKHVVMSVIDILRFSGGKVVERWGAEDNLSLMQQLGVVPSSR